MGYISKVKIPSETEAYDIFADKSLKDGDGNVISTTYAKTADAPKIGTADIDNELRKIEYTEESAIPPTPNAETEYACTDFIGYNDLDSNLQEKIDSAISEAEITAGNGIVIDKNETGDGIEIKVDPNKDYLSRTAVGNGKIPVAGDSTWLDIAYTAQNIASTLMSRDSNGNSFVKNLLLADIPQYNTGAARLYEVGGCVSIIAAANATNGTLTSGQLAILNQKVSAYTGGNINNGYILFDHERYYPVSYEKQAGYKTYVCSTSDEVKMISVNTTTGVWTLTKAVLPKTNNFVKQVRLSVNTPLSIDGTGDAQIKPNSIYMITGWKDTDFCNFTLNHRDGSYSALHALVFVDDVNKSYGFVITGSIILSNLAKAFMILQSCVPADGGFLQIHRVALDNT